MGYVWMIGEEKLEGKILNEELFVDPSGLSIFSQILKYKPSREHANKTIRCVVTHPGLVKEVSASTKVNLVGDDNAALAAAGLSAGGVVGIVVAGIVVLVFAAISVLALRGKFSGAEKKEKLDEEKAANEADNTSQTESAHEELKQEEKKSFQAKITKFFTVLKSKDKKAEDIVATEWEKVDLSVAHQKEPQEEQTDEEKEEENESHKPENFGGKITAFLEKFKQAPKQSAKLESKKTEEENVDPKSTEKSSEELKELEPEDKEENAREKRIGSEPPV